MLILIFELLINYSCLYWPQPDTADTGVHTRAWYQGQQEWSVLLKEEINGLISKVTSRLPEKKSTQTEKLHRNSYKSLLHQVICLILNTIKSSRHYKLMIGLPNSTPKHKLRQKNNKKIKHITPASLWSESDQQFQIRNKHFSGEPASPPHGHLSGSATHTHFCTSRTREKLQSGRDKRCRDRIEVCSRYTP